MRTTGIQQSQAQVVVLSITVIAFSIGELSQSARRRGGARYVDLRGKVAFRLVFLTGILMVPLAKAIAPGAAIRGGAVTFVVGVVLAWLGFLLRWWSFLVLGPNFTLVLKTSADQTVVDRGPYRVLPHPSYSGLLLAVLGYAVALGNWVTPLLGERAMSRPPVEPCIGGVGRHVWGRP